MKKTPPDIHQKNKCAKFQQNRTIFEASRQPQSFSLVLAKNSSPDPKNQNFWKMKKTPPDILHGTCIQPNFCGCVEGYTGKSCEKSKALLQIYSYSQELTRFIN